MTRKALATFILPALVVAACGVEGGSDSTAAAPTLGYEGMQTDEIGPEPEYVEPILRDTVTIFDPAKAQHFGILPNKLVIPVAGNEALALVEPGHVFAARYLFFKKVVTAKRDRDFWVFETVEAALTDAVIQGTFDLAVVGTYDPETNAIGFYDEADDPFIERPAGAPVEDEGTPFGQGRYKLSYEFDKTYNTPVDLVAVAGITFANRWYNLDAGGRLRVMPILNAHFRPKINVKGKVSCCENWSFSNPFASLNPKLDYVQVTAEGTLDLEAGFHINATAAASGAIDVLVLGQSGALKSISCFQAGGSIGPLPVTARICPSMRFKGNYKVDGAMDIEAKVAYSKTVGAGIIYRDSTWMPYFNDGDAVMTPTVTRDIQFTLEATATVSPRIEADISGVLGGNIQVDATATLASRCVAPNMDHVLSASIDGKAKAYMGPLNLLVVNIPKTEKEWNLFALNYPNLWHSTAGTCVPSYVNLTYNAVPADRAFPQGRTLDLDLIAEVPGMGGTGTETVMRDGPGGTTPPSEDSHPFLTYSGANAAGMPESLLFSRVMDGTYKIAVYDYENQAAANDSFTRSRARVSMWIGNGQLRTFNAPAGTYNRWNVANVTRSAQGAITIAPVNQTLSEDLYP